MELTASQKQALAELENRKQRELSEALTQERLRQAQAEQQRQLANNKKQMDYYKWLGS